MRNLRASITTNLEVLFRQLNRQNRQQLGLGASIGPIKATWKNPVISTGSVRGFGGIRPHALLRRPPFSCEHQNMDPTMNNPHAQEQAQHDPNLTPRPVPAPSHDHTYSPLLESIHGGPGLSGG